LDSNVKPTKQNPLNKINYNALFAVESMIHWHRRWYLSAGIQYDADTKQLIQSHATIDYKGDNNQLVQLNHRYANDVSGYEIDQIGFFTSVPLNQKWQFIASYHRDLVAKRSTELFAGLQYESCCWAIQLTGNRQIETDLNKTINQDDAQFDSSIRLNFILKGLGGKSNNDVSRLLQQGIFGYRRPYFLNN
jgi:LPS-assembly protein